MTAETTSTGGETRERTARQPALPTDRLTKSRWNVHTTPYRNTNCDVAEFRNERIASEFLVLMDVLEAEHQDDDGVCRTCTDENDNPVPWPCATGRARRSFMEAHSGD